MLFIHIVFGFPMGIIWLVIVLIEEPFWQESHLVYKQDGQTSLDVIVLLLYSI